ncbi:MAG: prenyltransferase/squalene oxidase repeat-containing protein [Victivallales bacterium]
MLQKKITDYIFSLADEDGGFQASAVPDFLGVADGKVSEIAPATYAAEIAQTLGMELPYPEKTIEYIQARQRSKGYFVNLTPLPGVPTHAYLMYNTCVGLRGLKALGKKPKYDPRKWLDGFIRRTEKISAYDPDFYANSYAALEDKMKTDCFQKLADFILSCQDENTGWLLQPGLTEAGYPLERNNPFTFHSARFFYLAGKRIPSADKILETFMRVQESDGSWKLGGVHGTFDACVAVRMLSDNSEKYQKAVRRGAEWALTCQREDGGFNHFGAKAIKGYIDNAHSEMDACYFHISTLAMAGMLPFKIGYENNWTGWGHSLVNGKN